MGFNIFGGAKDLFFGPQSSKSSNDPNSPYYAGGSQSFSGLDPAAMKQWKQLFSGYTSSTGYAPWQEAGFNSAVNLAANKFSALDAARGGNNPYTVPQIASSAAQYVAPQFAQLNSQALNNLMAQRQISTSTSLGPGLRYLDTAAANNNWWGMWNNIGSAWGSLGTSGKGGGSKGNG